LRRRAPAASFQKSVFINCPFDEAYLKLLRPLLFTILRLGFNPRIASESSDSGQNRIDKIAHLIRNSRYGMHDISRSRAPRAGAISRFNLPFELGLDRGAQLFGSTRLRNKRFLMLETRRYTYHRALSDLSGVDIKPHGDNPAQMVRAIRDWFVETVRRRSVPSASQRWYEFTDFASEFYDERKAAGFRNKDLSFMPTPEYIHAIRRWLVKKGLR